MLDTHASEKVGLSFVAYGLPKMDIMRCDDIHMLFGIHLSDIRLFFSHTDAFCAVFITDRRNGQLIKVNHTVRR